MSERSNQPPDSGGRDITPTRHGAQWPDLPRPNSYAGRSVPPRPAQRLALPSERPAYYPEEEEPTSFIEDVFADQQEPQSPHLPPYANTPYGWQPPRPEMPPKKPMSRTAKFIVGLIAVGGVIEGTHLAANYITTQTETHTQAGATASPTPKTQPSQGQSPDKIPTPKPSATVESSPTPTVGVPVPQEEDPNDKTLVVASANDLGASHTSKNGNKPGVKNYPARMRGLVSILMRPKHRPDIIGFQEMQSPQRRLFQTLVGGNYSLYPGKLMPRHHFVENSIAYNPKRLKVIQGGYDTIQYFNSNNTRVPRILFEDLKTGVRFYAINTHDPADTNRYHGQAVKRVHDARVHDAKNEANIAAGYPVIYTGDANSSVDPRPADKALGGNINLQSPQILTRSGKMHLAWDIAKGATAKTRESYRKVIDLILVSDGTSVSEFHRINTGSNSDHMISEATITLPLPKKPTS